MTHPFLALSLGFGGVILATQIAFSAPECDTRAAVTALLAESYGETRHAIGIAGEAAVMELFAAEATGTWSITLALPDGRKCLMASGSGFEVPTESLPAPGDRT